MSSRKRQKDRISRSSHVSSRTSENPFHILMASDDDPLDSSKLRLNGHLRRDYLSKRHRLMQMCKAPRDRETESFWSGATPTEIRLLSCCDIPNVNVTKDDDYAVAGALHRSAICKFVGLTAVDCHDLPSRALALAILERTWEADEEAKELLNAYSEKGKEITVSSPSKKQKAYTGKFHIARVGTKGKADRLLTFFAGGGLRILNNWLVDASTPIRAPPPKPPPTQSGRPRRSQPSEMYKPSSTGQLLLPLLVLLTFGPFHMDLVTKSKINKQIRKLSKETDLLVAEAQQNPSKYDPAKHTDPKLGGLLVAEVKKALDNLKEVWKSKQKEESEEPATDPFAAIKAALSDRLKESKKYDLEEGEKPSWMLAMEEKAKKHEARQLTGKKRASLEEMAKLERDKERQRMLKGDLKKAAEERKKLMDKIREMNSKKTSNETSHKATTKKSLRWKDGYGSKSSGRNRDKLEEIHVLKAQEEVDSQPSQVDGAVGENEDEEDDADLWS